MSPRPLAILSPGYPDAKGGVTDHTHRIAKHWRAEGYTVHIQSQIDISPRQVVARLRDMDAAALLIQYVPFLYARWGVSRLPETVARLAARHKMRVTTFVHEPWVPLTRPSWLVLSPLQRRQLHRLIRVSHAYVTSVPAWRPLLGDAAELVYVGSNLGSPASATGTPPGSTKSPVVFSPFAGGLNWKWIAAAVEAIDATPGLTVVGADAAAGRQHPATRSWARDSWEWLGYLEPSEILAAVGRSRVVLAPFIDGATGRRTSMLASLSTGVKVISASGPLLDPVFRDSPVTLAASDKEFVQAAVDAWSAPDDADERQQRIAWYARHFDHVTLDQRLLSIMLGEAALMES